MLNKSIQELYIPIQLTSIRFLSRDRIAAALKQTFPGQSGFEVLDLLSAHTQSLLDPDDPNLVFAFNKDAVGRAITMFRVAGIFLVCNEKLGFFIDRRGRLAIDFPIFKWKETPSAFIVHEPYLLAFANQRIEVWNLETAEMVQKVPGPYIPLNMAESGDQILTLDLFSKEVTEIEFLNQK
ncbi:citron-like protein [Mycena amicta]|nr:citron-like protein [Mycena amicta]